MSEDNNNPVNLPITSPTPGMVRQVLAQASAKLSLVEMQVLLHFGSQMYVEQVRVFSSTEAKIVEDFFQENKQRGLRLPKDAQDEMTTKMSIEAIERTIDAFSGSSEPNFPMK